MSLGGVANFRIPFPRIRPPLIAGDVSRAGEQIDRDFAEVENRFNASALAARAYQTTNQTGIPTGTWTTVTQATAQDDPFGIWASNTFTLPETGWYQAHGEFLWSNVSTGSGRGIRFLLNGSTVRGTLLVPTSSGFGIALSSSPLLRVSTVDTTVQLECFHDRGTPMSILGGTQTTVFSIAKVGNL